jgi:hypothetical protein
MTVAEKLRNLAEMSEQDPGDLHRIIWRLDVLRDEVRAEIDAQNGAFIDSLINLRSAGTA